MSLGKIIYRLSDEECNRLEDNLVEHTRLVKENLLSSTAPERKKQIRKRITDLREERMKILGALGQGAPEVKGVR
ncbi:hypothetical protein [Petroclostridium sp. X23]|uniref:hypothetical protein n=1 Tax=Petroclostridium sp. X23 TaxID=3045146 RepID=UPI0024AE7614|nr:hypothetical protein [Petroclostridium sp. X23]WHH59121.1 hypothetical protein QKW49_25605 [Petroclostridium sp. X23]